MALLLGAACWLAVWHRSPPTPIDLGLAVRAAPVAYPRGGRMGPFAITGAWRLTSPRPGFDSISAIGIAADGRFLAISDRGREYRFPQPGRAGASTTRPIDISFPTGPANIGDAESLVLDPSRGRHWISLENFRGIVRFDAGGQNRFVHPAPMRHWPRNEGAEAMVRLPDGRFVVLAEGISRGRDRTHVALLFAGDPIDAGDPLPFHLAMAGGMKPVEAGLLPDGRVLILGRDLRLPFRFVTTLSIADPAEIRIGGVWQTHEIARLRDYRLSENYEAMAIEDRPDGRIVVWLASDNNESLLIQKTLLLRLEARKSALRSLAGAPSKRLFSGT